jgi:hypothetical protein
MLGDAQQRARGRIRVRSALSLDAGRHAHKLAKTSAERAERRAAHRGTQLGDVQLPLPQQQHRALDASRHEAGLERFTERRSEPPAPVASREVHSARELLDVGWTRTRGRCGRAHGVAARARGGGGAARSRVPWWQARL